MEDQRIIEEKIIYTTGDVKFRKYKLGRLLGKGYNSKCYIFINLENNQIFAGKIISKYSLIKSKDKQKLINNIKIHKSLHHPNILNLEHYFEDTENFYILLEICQNQSLNELLKRRKRLTEIEVQCYIVQLIKALKYLHDHKIIHRNLKLESLLLTDKMELKIGGFSLATKLNFEGERKRTICGASNYLAPEILANKNGYSYEVDIWAIGVIVYTLIIGRPPFETVDIKSTYKRIIKNYYSFPELAIISNFAHNLISQILVKDPGKRPTLDQILVHDFFNQGKSIPKLLPTSTLALPPSLSYIRIFMPDAGEDGIVNKPVITLNLNDLKVNKDIIENNINNTMNPNLKGPDIWVKKWVDYSSKYGLGYLLNNGFFGVFYNDSSKIILNPITNEFLYIGRNPIDKQEVIVNGRMDNYPIELKNKVALLGHFKNYLEGEGNNNKNDEKKKDKDIDNEKDKKKEKKIDEKSFIYVKKWMKTRHAIMFRLTNKIVQVYFQDHTEILLSSESKVVTYVNKKEERLTYPLSKALEDSNYEMTKRLKYTKDILTHMLNMNIQRNKQKEINNELKNEEKSNSYPQKDNPNSIQSNDMKEMDFIEKDD